MALWQWSTTPADNANVGNIDWAPNMPPSAVNPSARQMMADVATWFQSPEWLNYGLTPTFVSATSFTLVGNQTAIYAVGRRVRTFNTGGTFYGIVVTSVFSSLTTVTVRLDSGSLDSGLSEVDVGVMNPAFPSLGALSGSLSINDPSTNTTASLAVNTPGNANGSNILLVGNGTTTPNKTIRALNGLFHLVNSGYSAVLLAVDDSGNMSVTGNITANSDERLKKDWKPVAPDFLERLSEIKSGTYRRIDIGERQTGVSAQDLLEVLPEAVSGAAILSVAYGQAALVACVELAKEVIELRGRVQRLERGE